MMQVTLSPCYILYQRPFREKSLLIDVLSQEYGRCRLIAKIRHKPSPTIGLLQIYQPLLLSWLGRTDLFKMTAIEASGPAHFLQGQATLCGLYINELLIKLLPQFVSEPTIFDCYQQTLEALASDKNNEITLRLFEKRLLTALGYGLALDYECSAGLPIDADKNYYYVAESGLYLWEIGCPNPAISGRSIQHLADERGFDETSLLEIKRLMRAMIQFYLAGKVLNSRALFSQLNQIKR